MICISSQTHYHVLHPPPSSIQPAFSCLEWIHSDSLPVQQFPVWVLLSQGQAFRNCSSLCFLKSLYPPDFFQCLSAQMSPHLRGPPTVPGPLFSCSTVLASFVILINWNYSILVYISSSVFTIWARMEVTRWQTLKFCSLRYLLQNLEKHRALGKHSINTSADKQDLFILLLHWCLESCMKHVPPSWASGLLTPTMLSND